MKIALIGSTRFMDEYRAVNKALTLAGHVVYTVATISSSVAGEDLRPTDEEKVILDLVHLRKIQESEAVVLITDETGYYGESTKRELIWADMLNKPVSFPSDFERPPKDFSNDFKEYVKARMSKEPDAMERYFERVNGLTAG